MIICPLVLELLLPLLIPAFHDLADLMLYQVQPVVHYDKRTRYEPKRQIGQQVNENSGENSKQGIVRGDHTQNQEEDNEGKSL
jgi:hypothetical protein